MEHEQFNNLMQKGFDTFSRLFDKSTAKPKYILGHNLTDSAKRESFEERINVLGFIQTEGTVWMSNFLSGNMTFPHLVKQIRLIKKFILANHGTIIIVSNEYQKRVEKTI
jgi:hypothetical protein